MMRARSIAIWVAAFASACGPTTRNQGGDDTDGGTTPGVDSGGGPTVDAVGCTKMDLLFVIDNSGSMGQEQANLIANFPMFITVLDQSGLDYRVAVTTPARDYTYYQFTPIGNLPQSTSGESGAMIKPASCNMTKRWIDK